MDYMLGPSFYFISFHDKEIAKVRQISGELCQSCNFLSIRADFTQRCIQTNRQKYIHPIV